MPRTYLLTLLARTLPEAMLVGLGCAVFLASRAPQSHGQPRSNGRSLGVLAVVGMAVLPPIYFFTVAPTAFNGTRHYLFILPPLAVMAALGIDRLLQRLPHGAARIVAGGFAASLALTIVRMIELHPDEYVYFNDASGGIGAANHHYELDYWGVSLRETTAKLVERLVTTNLADPRRPLKVWVCADTLSAAHYFPPWLHVVSDAEEADLVIGLEQFFCPHPSLGHLITSAKRQGVTLSWAGDRTGFVSHSLAQHGETHSGRSSSGGTP
jgi:hypothetical protein